MKMCFFVAILEVAGLLCVCVVRKRGRERVCMLHQIAGEVIKEERCKLIVQKAAGSSGSLVDDFELILLRGRRNNKKRTHLQQILSYRVKNCPVSQAFLAKQYRIYVYPVNFKYYN